MPAHHSHRGCRCRGTGNAGPAAGEYTLQAEATTTDKAPEIYSGNNIAEIHVKVEAGS